MDRIQYRYIMSILIIVFSFPLIIACAGSVTQIPPEQAVSQIKQQEKRSELQNQIIGQMDQGKSTAAYTDYAVGPEDLLSISFYGQDDLDREVRVNGRGEIALPLVGTVPVSGSSPQDIETRLVQLFKEKRIIKDPQISVFVKEYRNQRVMVTGAVATPGSYEVIGPRSLLEMLGKAGGLTDKAGNVVHIIRNQNYADLAKNNKRQSLPLKPFAPGSETIIIDLSRMISERAMELNVPIKNGDVIHVPFAYNAYVLGAVNRPGNVMVKDNLTATQAVAMAGGVNPLFATNQIVVIRLDDKGQRTRIPIDLSRVTAGENVDVPLKENDIVFVQESGLKRFLFNFKALLPGAMGMGASVPIYP